MTPANRTIANMPTITQLLQQSRAAHDAYRQALPRVDPITKHVLPGDTVAADLALLQALALRVRAEELDVSGEARIWRDDASTHPHYALLKFYADAELVRVKARQPRRLAPEKEPIT